MTTAVRQPKGSDQAYSVTLSVKVNLEQHSRVREAAGSTPVSEWLRSAITAALTARQEATHARS